MRYETNVLILSKRKMIKVYEGDNFQQAKDELIKALETLKYDKGAVYDHHIEDTCCVMIVKRNQ